MDLTTLTPQPARISMVMMATLFFVSSLFTACVTETLTPERSRYTYTVINENKVEPFADSPCAQKPEHGTTRISVGHEGEAGISVCSAQALRKLGPERYAADEGHPFAIALKQKDSAAFPLTRSEDEEQAFIIDYSQHAGISVLYPIARVAPGKDHPVYHSLYGRSFSCVDGACRESEGWVCTVKPGEYARLNQFVNQEASNSPYKQMNLANFKKAEEIGCFQQKGTK